MALFSREKHAPEESAHECLIGILRILTQPIDEVELHIVEISAVVRGQIGLCRRYAPLKRACVCFLFAHENLEQHCLRCPVRTDKGHLIPFFEGKADVLKELPPVDLFGEPFDRQQLIACLAVRGECDVRIAAGGRFDIIERDALEEFLARGSLPRFCSICRKALDEGLQLLDLLLFLLVRIFCHLQGKLAGLVPEVVVAGVERDLAEVHVADIGADLVEEVTIMRDNDDRVRKVCEKVLEPVDRGDVKMVRRLIEEQDIGRAEECLCEQDTHFLRGRDLIHLEVVLRVRHTETVEQLCRLCLGVPTVEFRELPLKL